jgi:hypothetical protein
VRSGRSLESGLEMDEPLDEQREQIRKWAYNGATDRDICEKLGIDERKLLEKFGDFLVETRVNRRLSLRGKQTEIAIKGGNASMLSLLGKNELGQGRASAAGEADEPEPDLEPKVG